MAYATVDDLAARFPRALTPAETVAAEVMLDDASFLLSTKVPGLDAAVESEDEVITRAAMMVTVDMVTRSLLARATQQTRDPSIDSIGETFGPYGRNIKYRSGSGSLWIYGSEYDYLFGLLRDDMSEAVSLRSPGF